MQHGWNVLGIFSFLMILLAIHPGCSAGEIETQDNGWQVSPKRWSMEKANAWYSRLDWIAGANFVPSTASNQFEMWQAETWDPEAIDRELGWAEDIGFNAMRVYLHDMLWTADAEGFEKRIDEYLSIADRHGIRTILVLFDSVWDPFPKPGPQKEPVPHVHNSRWVQSPHIDIQKNPDRYEELKPYATAILSRFRNDARVLAWDLFNEPGNPVPQYQPKEGWSRKEKEAAHLVLLSRIFDWAREVNPAQPLTAGIWVAPGRRTDPVQPLDRLMLERSDIITFHTYRPLEEAKTAVEWLQKTGRPIICTEYMSRGSGSTFDTIMPYFKEQQVGAINWGLVNGRSQTIYPWDSWDKKYTREPDPWFHDIFRKDGTLYDSAETDLIRKLTAKKATYSNPILDAAALADPHVIEFQGTYYLYPTCDGRGYDVYSSKDLVNWKFEKRCFEDPRGGVWAPDVFHYTRDGRFYLYYTAGPLDAKVVGVAVADSPLGPFKDAGVLRENAIDAHMFEDGDGSLYLYYVHLEIHNYIHVQPMADPLHRKGESKRVIAPEDPWETAAGRVAEGPWMIKRDGTYYLMYSGSGANSPHYAIGYATSDSPMGPFTKYAGNPIVKSGNGVIGPGHHSVVKGPDGNLWMAYHQKFNKDINYHRFLAVDPLWFDEDGAIHARVTRNTKEPLPAGNPAEQSRQ